MSTTLLQCRGLTAIRGERTLFEAMDLTIRERDKIGLVGENGCGKSTLFTLLDGSVTPDAGEVTHTRALHLETVEQFIAQDLLDTTLFDAIAQRLPASRRVTEGFRVEQMLASMGFTPGEYEFRVGALSGGQQNRLMFARALITEPNCVLFDEPTNHLDLATILVFEQTLRDLRAGFLLISHDREFLDAVTDRTLFLRDKRLYDFALPYSAAREKLDAQDAAAAATRQVQERQIASLRASTKRIEQWSRVHESEKLARKARNMERRVERMEANRTYVSPASRLRLGLDTGATRSKRMLTVENHPVSFGDRPLFFIEQLVLRPGQRVALLGANGVGKTTFIQSLVEAVREPSDTIRPSPQCELGYYDQELQLLPPGATIREALARATDANDDTVTRALVQAGFAFRDHGKETGVLSGGERARLMFLVMRLLQPNFLILDEPTNHIDISGKEALEEQLIASAATVLITSHDRRFIERVANRFLHIDGGKLTEVDSPAVFYSSNTHEQPATETSACDPVKTGDDPLERLVALEALLEADLARKPRFQKPLLQAEWRAEIEQLNKQLC